jgi:hypothetical protein
MTTSQIITREFLNPSSKGILVFTTAEILEHKKRDGMLKNDNYCFWDTRRFPVQLANHRDERRIYMAVNGQVKGYFIIESLSNGDEPHVCRIIFHSESWVEIGNGEQLVPSQGWRYYLHEQV